MKQGIKRRTIMSKVTAIKQMANRGRILDKIDSALRDCLAISELLWDSDDTNPETSKRVGVMLWHKIKKLDKNIDKLV